MRYGYVKLYRLYVANGGSKKYAPVMAAIALAESAGKQTARHVNRDGSVDQGFWQINSSNYSGSDIYDPNVNARWAVKLAEHSSKGLGNWTTFTSGKYRKYLPKQAKGDTQVPGKGFGVFTQGNYAGTDQGVDFKGTGPIPALGSGVVTDVGKAGIIEGGQYPYVVYRLTDGPYKGHYVYVAENFVPTVKKGTKLKVGQEIGKAVGAYPYIEVGFNKTGAGWNPVAPLHPNPHSPKPAGNTMWSYIQGVAKLHPGGGGGIVGEITSGVSTAVSDAANPGNLIATITGKAGSAIGSPIAGAVSSIGKEIMYAGAILGGGLTFILGLVLIAADIGLSTKTGKVAAAVPAGRFIARGAAAKNAVRAKTSEPKSNVPSREEQRREEKHQAQIKNIKARTKATKSQAKNRKRTVKEQKAAETKSYYKGATDAASPTMAKIRREKKK